MEAYDGRPAIGTPRSLLRNGNPSSKPSNFLIPPRHGVLEAENFLSAQSRLRTIYSVISGQKLKVDLVYAQQRGASVQQEYLLSHALAFTFDSTKQHSRARVLQHQNWTISHSISLALSARLTMSYHRQHSGQPLENMNHGGFPSKEGEGVGISSSSCISHSL